jgi:hypothetical protein
VQVLLQFTSGYHDVDLRDSTGLGHGRLIAAHAAPQVRDRWLPRLLAGDVPGIAITEPHGGTQVRVTATHAVPAAGGTWRVSGTKTWISRLTEAAVFCVFFTAPDGKLTAAAIDAGTEGLSRQLITPAGLSGWPGASCGSTASLSGRATSSAGPATGCGCCTTTSPATGPWSRRPRSARQPPSTTRPRRCSPTGAKRASSPGSATTR